jgi:hypothetical protein
MVNFTKYLAIAAGIAAIIAAVIETINFFGGKDRPTTQTIQNGSGANIGNSEGSNLNIRITK